MQMVAQAHHTQVCVQLAVPSVWPVSLEVESASLHPDSLDMEIPICPWLVVTAMVEVVLHSRQLGKVEQLVASAYQILAVCHPTALIQRDYDS